MRRQTEHVKQLKRMYSIEDGRLQGEAGWAKLAFFWFILFLSYKCTRKCSYCYVFNQIVPDTQKEMDDKTFSRLLEWVPEVWRANNVKVNAISFLGGEPLLRTDRIKKMMDSIYKNTDGMQGNVYTNGDLVDSVNWDDLEDIQWITTNITDISIEELARRMKIIRERANVIGQTIDATLDDFNLDRVLDITRFAIENGYRLRYYRNLFRGVDNEYKKRLLKKYHELCDLLESYIVKGYDVHTTFIIDTLIPLWDFEASPYLCGRRLATVYPDGTIGPCLRNHTFKTGTIFDADPLGKLQCDTFRFDIGKPDLPDECRACESRTACQGGCPYDKLLLTGTRSGKSVLCEIHKEIIPRIRQLHQLENRVKSEPGNIEEERK
jgi:radical SAM protein with 4Fe4S-binding SPASM domain